MKIISIQSSSLKNFLPICIVLFFLIVFKLFSGCSKEVENDVHIINPYHNVNWSTWGRYKASLHAHTTASDGHFSPGNVVDMYHNLNYDILAITDHDHVTYPWENFSALEPSDFAYNLLNEGIIDSSELVFSNRNASEMGMLSIQANEISSHHHLGSYFSDFNGKPNYITETLDEISKLNGLAVLFHPVKYSENLSWYKDLYQTYSSLTGLEVYNKKYEYEDEIYFDDFIKWDSLLSYFMPDRKINGFTNDDFHTVELGYAYNVFLMPELSEYWVKNTMTTGNFYFVISSSGHDTGNHPEIISIKVDQAKGSIEIIGTNYDYIEWISNGKTVHRKPKIYLNDIPDAHNYVRAIAYTEGYRKIAGTQAFGIQKK